MIKPIVTVQLHDIFVVHVEKASENVVSGIGLAEQLRLNTA